MRQILFIKTLCVFHPLGEGYYIGHGTVGVAEMPDSSAGRPVYLTEVNRQIRD
jgi:hypothetical protein